MPIEYIRWLDSHGGGGWQEPGDISQRSLIIESIGYFVCEHDDSVTLTTSVSVSGDVIDPITIPKCAIQDRFDIVFSDG